MPLQEGRPVRKTFPVNTLIEGRRVLVAGGGRVGLHKIELLIDAGAAVTLVCPDCVPELKSLADSKAITHLARPFEDGDIAGAVLVFACTDDKHVNRHILEACQAARVLCCCADGNWADGDFVTPAIVRTGEVLIAVSTSGKSCRQSRLIKEHIRQHIESIEGSDLLVIGTSHECLGNAERAPYHLLLREREALGAMLRQLWGIHEFFILNTCNRIEVVALVTKEAAASGILTRLLHFDRLRPDLYYVKQGFEAFAHVCRVTAGMDSQIPGEVHIVGQLKDAVEEAAARGWSGPVIRELTDDALRISKEIHVEIDPLLNVAEIEEIALRYLAAGWFLKHPDPVVAVIGAGVLGRNLVENLIRRHCRVIWAYHVNRPEPKAVTGGSLEIVQLDALPARLPAADTVIAAVDSREPVLTVARHRASLNPAGVMLIDLGMPRNIDPAFDALGGSTRIQDLDSLKHWVRESDGSLARAEQACRAVTERNRPCYDRLLSSLQGPASPEIAKS